jgi:hypothetical protein
MTGDMLVSQGLPREGHGRSGARLICLESLAGPWRHAHLSEATGIVSRAQ